MFSSDDACVLLRVYSRVLEKNIGTTWGIRNTRGEGGYSVDIFFFFRGV